MNTLKTALRTIAQWVVLLMIGFAGWAESGSMTLYQQALIAEKNAGDFHKALQLYEQILADIKGEDAWMVSQVRARVVVLRARLGLPKRVDTQPQTLLSFQKLSIRDQTRQKTLPYAETLDRHLLTLKSQLGVDRLPKNRTEHLPSLSWIEIWFHDVRKALGVQSFSEKLIEIAAQRRKLRPMNFVGLFQAGLNAEKGAGDFQSAIGYYQRALDQTPDVIFQQQINKRLAFCQQQMQP